VTGAGRGIGAACARALSQRGYRVALLSPSGRAVELATELGGFGLTGRVEEYADLEQLVNEALGRWGRVDGVVVSTGTPGQGDLLQLSDRDWMLGLELIFLSVVRLARLLVPTMTEQGGGAFVTISSLAAVEPNLSFPISSAMRAALAGFTKMFADRYATVPIRMNSVLPGFVNSAPENPRITEKIPMKRYGDAAEVAHVVAFLLSEQSGYVTGQNLRVDGGLGRSL
jgi:NAD(P)-dependent dehydrogenase (short-subunit alcohol dehydrogenase family)